MNLREDTKPDPDGGGGGPEARAGPWTPASVNGSRKDTLTTDTGRPSEREQALSFAPQLLLARLTPIRGRHGVLISYDCITTHHQLGILKPQTFICSEFWRLEVKVSAGPWPLRDWVPSFLVFS